MARLIITESDTCMMCKRELLLCSGLVEIKIIFHINSYRALDAEIGSFSKHLTVFGSPYNSRKYFT